MASIGALVRVAANTRFSNDQIQTPLDRILAWEGIVHAEQMRECLRFVVEASLRGKSDGIKAYTIATDVLGRSKDFDPQADPIVRIVAGHLRRRLANYYATSGRDDPIRIEIPKGAYKPVFHTNGPKSSVAADPGTETTKNLSIDSPITDAERRQGPSVAVMPFLTLNNDREFDYFACTLGEESTSRLSLPKGLAVVPHDSMMPYKDKLYDLKQVAREQNLDHLVTGSICRGEGRLRLTLQLTALPNSRQIWDNAFD